MNTYDIIYFVIAITVTLIVVLVAWAYYDFCKEWGADDFNPNDNTMDNYGFEGHYDIDINTADGYGNADKSMEDELRTN